MDYGRSLGEGGSGNRVKDVWKKLQWAFREKDRLCQLRVKLQDSMLRLSWLSTLAAR